MLKRAISSSCLLVALGCAHDSSPRKSADAAAAPASAAPASAIPSAVESAAPPPKATSRDSTTSGSGPSHQHDGAHQHQHQHGYHMDFSEVERFARHFDDPARNAWQRPKEIVQWMGLAPGHVVADIGAGTGYFIPYLSEAVGSQGTVLALDVEPNMVRFMEQRIAKSAWSNARARVVASNDPGLSPSSVDRILIVNTWHHIDDRSAYAAKLARALKPGGSIYIVDFTLDSDIGPPPAHRLSPEVVVRELSGQRLEAAIVAGETLPKQYIVRATLR